jgi:hypothetical protein
VKKPSIRSKPFPNPSFGAWSDRPAFFIFVCYTEVLGIQGYKDTLDKVDAPLNVLSSMYGVPFLSPILSAGAMFSFFALALSCMNAGARVMFVMGRHDFFPKSTSTAHTKHSTPHVALAVMAVVMFAIVTASKFAFGWAVLDEFNNAGTMGAFGFLGAYFLVSLAAPAFLKKRGELKGQRHRDVRGGGTLDDHSDRGHVCAAARPARALFPLRFRRVPVLRLRPRDGDATSETGRASRKSTTKSKKCTPPPPEIMAAIQIGSVASLHRYPVKSMLGEELNVTRVGTKGFQGDRALRSPT